MGIFHNLMKRIPLLCAVLMAVALGSPQSLNAQCQAAFSTSVTNLDAQFTNQATGSYNWIGWDYGDGNWESYIANPLHTYAQAGVYVACQYIQDTLSTACFDYTCDTLFIGGATCLAQFYPTINGLNVEFYNSSIGQYDAVLWDFGDGSTSSSPNPTHSYSSAGFYSVCLSLMDNSALCDSTCYTIYVEDGGCFADFTFSTDGLSVDFTNLSSGNFDMVSWDFGDGIGWSGDMNPTYEYLAPGTYEVCLYIYDSMTGNCNAQYCQYVTVASGGGGACDANYTYVANELYVECTNTSTGTYTTAIWDFGDGSTPGFDNTHTYAAPGTYEVCLTIGNIFPFCVDFYCEEITVNEYTCETGFTYNFNSANIYQFTNTTTGNFTSVLWEFGDGNTSTFASPSYSYNQPGTYDVCLTTFDGANICGMACQEVPVFPLGLDVSPVYVSEFMAYPNPSEGALYLAIPTKLKRENLSLRVDVLDPRGRIVASHSENAVGSELFMQLDLPAGIYYLNISAAQHTKVLPVIMR